MAHRVQPWDADLAALGALNTTAFGRSQLEVADAAAARTLINAANADNHRQVRLNADFTTTLNTLQNTNLAIALTASEAVLVEIDLIASCSGSGGFRVALLLASATVEVGVTGHVATLSAFTSGRMAASAAESPTYDTNAAAQLGPIRVYGSVIAPAGGGTLRLQARSITSGQTTTIKAGAGMRVVRGTSV